MEYTKLLPDDLHKKFINHLQSKIEMREKKKSCFYSFIHLSFCESLSNLYIAALETVSEVPLENKHSVSVFPTYVSATATKKDLCP